MSGPVAARLICMGIDVLADTCEARAFDDLRDLLVYAGGGDHERGLREVLRMLADAADSAIDVHEGDCETLGAVERMTKFRDSVRLAMGDVT
jgi:hypothetical protein